MLYDRMMLLHWGQGCPVKTSCGITRPAGCLCCVKECSITYSSLCTMSPYSLAQATAEFPHGRRTFGGTGAMNHTRTHCVADMKLLHSSLGWINEMSEWAILVQWVFCGQLKVSYILHADELLFCTIFLFLKYTCLAVEILDNLSICRFFRCQRVVIVLPIRQKLSFFLLSFQVHNFPLKL